MDKDQSVNSLFDDAAMPATMDTLEDMEADGQEDADEDTAASWETADALFEDKDSLPFNSDRELPELTDEQIANMSEEEIDYYLWQLQQTEEMTKADEPEDTDWLNDLKEVTDTPNNFISESGEIVVMDTDGDETNSFMLKYIDINKILVGKRIRDKNTNTVSLCRSIKSTGVLKPIVVAPTLTEGIYVLIDGFRRILACAQAGKRSIPCLVNLKVNTSEIPVLEALYNHNRNYSNREIITFIEYLEKEKGITQATMIEYLLQLNSGAYTKLKDVLEDGDEEILQKLYLDMFTIEQAFKKLEARRRKESADEKAAKQAAKVYEDEVASGADRIAGSGDELSEEELTLSEDELKELNINITDFNNLGDTSLNDMLEESQAMEGFEPHVQDPNHRERIDPAIRKAVLSRDNNTCQCCLRGGPDYVDILDLHHIVEVYLGGEDSVENGLTLCLNCHRQVHSFAFNRLHIPKTKALSELEAEATAVIAQKNAWNSGKGLEQLTPEEEETARQQYYAIYREEQNKYKRIVYLGNIIRKGLQKKGMKVEQARKEHPIHQIGRHKPGQRNQIG